jgi:hypothetical protein
MEHQEQRWTKEKHDVLTVDHASYLTRSNDGRLVSQLLPVGCKKSLWSKVLWQLTQHLQHTSVDQLRVLSSISCLFLSQEEERAPVGVFIGSKNHSAAVRYCCWCSPVIRLLTAEPALCEVYFANCLTCIMLETADGSGNHHQPKLQLFSPAIDQAPLTMHTDHNWRPQTRVWDKIRDDHSYHARRVIRSTNELI